MEELLVKYFSGEATQEETKEVLNWRSAKEDNAKAFLEYKNIWFRTGSVPKPNKELLDRILEGESEKFKIIPLWKQKSFQIAASLLLAVGIIFTVIQSQTDQPYGRIVSEVTEIDLPDGSIATLYRGSSIDINDFKKTREVKLNGRAFFDVKRNEAKPFLVLTEGAKVQVLGTSFVVKEEGASTEVLVESGLVSFGQNPTVYGNNAMAINLAKGEMGIIKKGEKGIKKKRITDQNYLSWKTQVISFERASLEEVGRTLKDVYAVNIKFENSKLLNCNLTAKFKEKSSDEIIRIISETFDLTVERNEEGVVMNGEGCN